MDFLEKLSAGFNLTHAKEFLEYNYINEQSCWIWRGNVNAAGYGIYKGILVHRLSYAIFRENFHISYFICHHCDRPRCYNPEHLYLGDTKTNGHDASIRKRIKSASIYNKKELNNE